MRNRPPVVAANNPDEVEEAFYQALQRGDLEALMAVWAEDDEICCVHPGGERVFGALAIRASFEAIFAQGGIPLQVEQLHRLETLNSAMHHLLEKVTVQGPGGQATAWVTASNWFVKTALGWRLASHHASPGVAQTADRPTAPAAPDSQRRLH